MMTDQKYGTTKLETNSISAEAASWVAQIDGDGLTNADRLALREWASRSPKHIAELRRLGEMWFDIDAVIQAELDEYNIKPSVTKFAISAIKAKPKQSYSFMAIAASCLLAAVVALMNIPNPQTPMPVQTAYSVEFGQHRVISLEDGSSIHANTDSFFEVEYSKNQRIIRLIKGEAFFDVAHDKKRPFLVYAGGNVVRAVGTAFVVRVTKKRETSVIVTEGKVAINTISRGAESVDSANTSVEPDMTTEFVSAGQSLFVKPGDVRLVAEVETISAEVIDKKLAWRNGLVIFEGEPLSQVVDEISRYTDTQIIISDPAIRDIPVGGVFPAGKVNALLGVLESSFGVSAKRFSDDVIYLTKAIEK